MHSGPNNNDPNNSDKQQVPKGKDVNPIQSSHVKLA